jgi:hypothetical protein
VTGLAIDPMALILSETAYLVWVEQHFPHVPKVAEIQAALRVMTPQERKAALSKARTMAAYGKAVEAAIKKIGKSNLGNK